LPEQGNRRTGNAHDRRRFPHLYLRGAWGIFDRCRVYRSRCGHGHWRGMVQSP
jgi:hypothetical protein